MRHDAELLTSEGQIIAQYQQSKWIPILTPLDNSNNFEETDQHLAQIYEIAREKVAIYTKLLNQIDHYKNEKSKFD